jgi:F420-non-reducing hydrogenase small subunit
VSSATVSSAKKKLKFAFYWAASCGGCEVAVLDTNEKILDVAALADIVLWPIAVDAKYKDVEAMGDKTIDVTFFNGAVRNSEQKHLAQVLRQKSKALVAFGSCAHLGGIPALANFYSRDDLMKTVYEENASTVNAGKVRPVPVFAAREGNLEIPVFFDAVYKLDQVVPVDYYLPGCPPTPASVLAAVMAIVEGKLPAPGSVLAPEKTVCDTCDRVKENKKVREFHRPHLCYTDPKKCLLEQGIVCCGPATRTGCDNRCLAANMPCRGCMGPTPGVVDQGAKTAAAIATLVDSKNEAEIRRLVDQVVDPAGTFYRFGLADGLFRGAAVKEVK